MAQHQPSEWLFPPAKPALAKNSVHVWRACLPAERPHLPFLMTVLSGDEQARAERFRRHEDRVSYALTRGILRCVLSEYVGRAPEKIRFEYTSYGKPGLVLSMDESLPIFNVSHSHRWALFALGKDRKIGVDVEYVRGELDMLGISRRFFSSRESALLHGTPEKERARLFYHIWVRKEAYVKALGKGLSMPLDCFDVPLGDYAPVTLNPREDPWHFYHIPVGPDYASALVTGPSFARLHRYHFQLGLQERRPPNPGGAPLVGPGPRPPTDGGAGHP